jgi:hypothetical protein
MDKRALELAAEAIARTCGTSVVDGVHRDLAKVAVFAYLRATKPRKERRSRE